MIVSIGVVPRVPVSEEALSHIARKGLHAVGRVFHGESFHRNIHRRALQRHNDREHPAFLQQHRRIQLNRIIPVRNTGLDRCRRIDLCHAGNRIGLVIVEILRCDVDFYRGFDRRLVIGEKRRVRQQFVPFGRKHIGKLAAAADREMGFRKRAVILVDMIVNIRRRGRKSDKLIQRRVLIGDPVITMIAPCGAPAAFNQPCAVRCRLLIDAETPARKIVVPAYDRDRMVRFGMRGLVVAAFVR